MTPIWFVLRGHTLYKSAGMLNSESVSKGWGGGGDVVMIKFYFGVDGVEVGNSNVVVVYVNDHVSWLFLI